MSEVLGIEKSMMSLLGVANSATMITTLVFINPLISGENKMKNMMLALVPAGPFTLFTDDNIGQQFYDSSLLYHAICGGFWHL